MVERFNVKYIENPSQQELRELTQKHTPAVLKTAYGNLDKITRNKARMAKYTYVIAEEKDKDNYSHNVIAPEKAKKLIAFQREYIEKELPFLIAIDGYLGNEWGKAVAAQWLYSPAGANVAGMQQVLAFPREMVEPPEVLKEEFRPFFQVVFTPELMVDEMPGKQAIIVDLENYVTYVIGADYFGESKKGTLRMLNHYVYNKGGLVLHAGAKEVIINGKRVGMAILGLSGTGKTTTTFNKQGDVTKPIQDDMVCLWPDNSFTVTENGCFAKTYGLKKETEPVIYNGTIDPSAWVENVFMKEDGTFDFSKQPLSPEDVAKYRDIFIETGANPENVDAFIKGDVKIEEVTNEYMIPEDGWDFVVWTQNGRSIIPMKAIKDAANLKDLPSLKYIGILNRDEGKDAATPGIIKFASPEQAAGYFMLGETSKTSAAGKERGKTRSPFTQPFFPLKMSLQADRFSELVAKYEGGLIMWLMNTGYIGGDERDEKEGKAIKVKIRHSSAMLEAMVKDEIKWKKDPDFGYFIVDVDAEENSKLLQLVPAEILNPIIFYEKNNRMDEYRNWVEKMKREREEFLRKYNVREEIIKAVIS